MKLDCSFHQKIVANVYPMTSFSGMGCRRSPMRNFHLSMEMKCCHHCDWTAWSSHSEGYFCVLVIFDSLLNCDCLQLVSSECACSQLSLETKTKPTKIENFVRSNA